LPDKTPPAIRAGFIVSDNRKPTFNVTELTLEYPRQLTGLVV
jgi:hypothetical protein